jgi:hypothetical protein
MKRRYVTADVFTDRMFGEHGRRADCLAASRGTDGLAVLGLRLLGFDCRRGTGEAELAPGFVGDQRHGIG